MPSNGRSIKFYKYYKQWVETYKVGQVRGVTLNKYYLVARQIKKLAPDLSLSKITRTDMVKHISWYQAVQLMENYTDRLSKEGKLDTKKDNFHLVLPFGDNRGMLLTVGPDENGDRSINFEVIDKIFVMKKDKNTVLDIKQKQKGKTNE